MAHHTLVDEHRSMYPLQTSVILALCTSRLNTLSDLKKAGQPNTWTPLKALVVSSQSHLSSQRLRAETTEPEVLSSHPSPLQRTAESIGAIAIVCCAGVLPPTSSEDLRKLQSSAERAFKMLSLPDTDNMVGTQTIEGMWTLALQGGVFVISAKLCRRIQMVAGQVKICAVWQSFLSDIIWLWCAGFIPYSKKVQIRWNEE